MAQRPGIGTRIPERHVPAFDLILHVPSLAERALFHREGTLLQDVFQIQIGFRRFQTASRHRKFRYGSEQIGGSLGKLVQHARITHQAADGEGPCGSAKRNQQVSKQLH